MSKPSSRPNSPSIESTRDAAIALYEDVFHLQREFSDPNEITNDKIRRSTAIVRRLFTHDDITRVAFPRVGQICFNIHDYERFRVALPEKLIRFSLFTYFINPQSEFFFFVVSGDRRRFGAELQVQTSRFSAYLQRTEMRTITSFKKFKFRKVLFAGGRWFSVQECLNFYANKRSGVHSDTNLNAAENALMQASRMFKFSLNGEHSALRTVVDPESDGLGFIIQARQINGSEAHVLEHHKNSEILEKYDPYSIDCVGLVVLSCIHYLLESKSIESLMKYIKKEVVE